jgi:hypothetical protein
MRMGLLLINSGYKTLAAFGAATAQNRATTRGLHTGPESMSPFALQFAGLEGTFHFGLLKS